MFNKNVNEKNVNNVLYPVISLDLFYLRDVVLYKQQIYDMAYKHNIAFSKAVSFLSALDIQPKLLCTTRVAKPTVERIAKPLTEKDVRKLLRPTHKIYSQILDKDPLVLYIRDLLTYTKSKLYSIIQTCIDLREIFGKHTSVTTWIENRTIYAYDSRQTYEFKEIELSRVLLTKLKSNLIKPAENIDVKIEQAIIHNRFKTDLTKIDAGIDIQEVANEIIQNQNYNVRAKLVNNHNLQLESEKVLQLPEPEIKIKDSENKNTIDVNRQQKLLENIEETKSVSDNESVESYKSAIEVFETISKPTANMTNLIRESNSKNVQELLLKMQLVNKFKYAKECYEKGECVCESNGITSLGCQITPALNEALISLELYHENNALVKSPFQYNVNVSAFNKPVFITKYEIQQEKLLVNCPVISEQVEEEAKNTLEPFKQYDDQLINDFKAFQRKSARIEAIIKTPQNQELDRLIEDLKGETLSENTDKASAIVPSQSSTVGKSGGLKEHVLKCKNEPKVKPDKQEKLSTSSKGKFFGFF